MIVYIYTFPNGKKYIGQTVQTVEKRSKNGEGYKESPKVYQAIKKYGWKNVKVKTIECKNQEEMDILEKKLIKQLKTQNIEFGYNIAPGGMGGPLTKEHKENISIALKNFYNTPEGKKLKQNSSLRQRELITNRKEEFNEYLKKARVNKTKEGYKNSIEALKEYYLVPEHQQERVKNGLKGAKARSKNITVFDKNFNFIGEFESGRQAAKFLNINHSLPSYALNHNNYSSNYYFFFTGDLTINDTDYYRIFNE